jgi:tetratricopeptide (TPR) repeat protein
MGNTNFTSAVISTLALALLAQKEIFNENNIVYTCIFSLITILSLYLLNSFQSILILCVGIYTFLTFKITKKLHVKFQKLMISLYLILWFLGMSFLYNFVHLDPISRILELSGNYGRRLEYWGYAIKMFQDSPLVGIGINGFLDKAQTLKSIDVIRADGPLVWIDSAHSAPLHLLATGGLTLFLPYCLLLFSTFFAALKISLSLSKDRLSDSIIASMWFAFTAQSLLSVSNAATLLFNAILTGIVWQRYFTLKLNEEKNQRKLMKIVLSTKIWQRLLSFHKLFVIIICIGFSGYLMATQIALSQNVLGNKVKIMNVFQVSKIFPSDRAIEYLADASLQRGEYQDAIKLLEKARVINRNGNRATYSLGVAYFYAGDQSAGIKHVSNALALDPYNTFYLEQLIRFQFRANQADDAAASLDALEKLNPDYPGLSSLRGLLSP